MQTVTLNNGVIMPQLGFGVWQVPDDEAQPAVEEALATGYRSIDTAKLYHNEEGVGRAVRASGVPRGELFLTTKLWNDEHDYDRALRAFDASLDRLGTDYVDLYLIHWPVPRQDKYLDAYKALEKVYADGRAKAIGVSNFDIEHLERLLGMATVVPAVNQVELHPRLAQADLRAFHARHGIATEAWSPLGQGQLLGDPVVAKVAAAHGRTPAQVILRWHLQNGVIAIPKSVTPSRIRENFAVFDFELSGEQMAIIDSLDSRGRIGPDPARMNWMG
jgi:2,5-diketo-D-gluconate reductase A